MIYQNENHTVGILSAFECLVNWSITPGDDFDNSCQN